MKLNLFKVIGHTSGQLVKPKKRAVAGLLKDFSVIILLFSSFNENDDPVTDATYSSFLSLTDKIIGNIIKEKITKQPIRIVIDVFNFINVIINSYV